MKWEDGHVQTHTSRGTFHDWREQKKHTGFQRVRPEQLPQEQERRRERDV